MTEKCFIKMLFLFFCLEKIQNVNQQHCWKQINFLDILVLGDKTRADYLSMGVPSV